MIKQKVIYSIVSLFLCFGIINSGILPIMNSKVQASHTCNNSVVGPYGGREINCTYYADIATHANFALAKWNWPAGYYNNGDGPTPGGDSANKFILWVQSDLWACGANPANLSPCPGATVDEQSTNMARAVGDSYIINTQLGINGQEFMPSGSIKNYMYGGISNAQARFNEWADLIRALDYAGAIDWDVDLVRSDPILTNIPGPECGGRGQWSDTVLYNIGVGWDETIYNNSSDCFGRNHYILFRDPNTNAIIYRINRNCGNVTGALSKLIKPNKPGFTNTPTAFINFTGGTPESPTQVTLSSTVTTKVDPFGDKVNGINVQPRLYYIKGSNPPVNIYNTASNNNTITESTPWNYTNNFNISGLGLVAGDKVCATTSVNPTAGQLKLDGSGDIDSVSTGLTTSAPPYCLVVVNRPYLKVYGNDVTVGSFGCAGISPAWGADNNTAGINTYWKGGGTGGGAGAELSVLAQGTINQFASAFMNLDGVVPDPPNGLTLANIGVGAPGGYAGAHCPTDFYGSAGGILDNVSNTFNLAPLNGKQVRTYKPPSGTLTLNNGNVQDGDRLTIFVDGNLIINSNIRYVNVNWGNLNQIPSVQIIVRGNIYIDRSVTRLDGLYVAQPTGGTKGTINTCTNLGVYFPANNLFNQCKQQLTINGALVAKTVQWQRTFGSLRDSSGAAENAGGSKAAERIIFSPEMFIVNPASPSSTVNSNANPDVLISLPPVL